MESKRIAMENGFKNHPSGSITGLYDFIDDIFISIHHWVKWHKLDLVDYLISSEKK